MSHLGGGYSVLVVDDEEGMRLGLEKALSLEGYQVTCAATGAEARRMTKAGRFDCAFVDLKLPDMPGTELLPDLREAGSAVVVITAYATVDTAVRAMKLGAVDYLQKPFDNQDVVAIAERLCNGNRVLRPDAESMTRGRLRDGERRNEAYRCHPAQGHGFTDPPSASRGKWNGQGDARALRA